MTEKEKEKNGVYFFGPIDRKEGKSEGRVTSEYPCWMHKFQIESLEEEIETDEKNMEYNQAHGLFDGETIFRLSEGLKLKKKKLEKILEARPKLTGKQKDDYYKEYNRLGSEIRNYLFTKSAMRLGTANPHEEADRVISPCDIQVSPELAKSLNLQTTPDGRVSRSQAEKAWKILGSYFHENTNTESLRADRITARTSRGGE